MTDARRWRIFPRSLAARLVVGVVGLVLVLVLATGIGTYLSLSSFLYSRVDQQLQTTACCPSSIEQLFSSSDTASSVGVQAPTFVWVVALDEAGNVLVDPPPSNTVKPMQLDAADRRMLAARTAAGPQQVSTVDGQVLRVTTVRDVRVLTPLGVEAGIVVIGLSTDEVDRTLRRLLELELLIGASAVTLTLVATTWGVRISLRRLHRVTRTAQEVAAELSPSGAGLERRVEVSESETEVGQLATSMNTLLSAVGTQFQARLDSERRMRQFLADASHELRTPLTSIRGFAELARIQRGLDGGAEVGDNLERIESEGTRMSRLVDDLLTLARTDQNPESEVPEWEVVDVVALVSDVVAGAQAAFPDRGIDASVAGEVLVRGDADQLLRVIRNLVNNAATHTEGSIRVTAHRDGDFVQIQVADQGPGLPPEEAVHVFERFWRADKARSRARGGSGLGMAIVASIVVRHGGTVHFASTVESGSTVTVRLPAVAD
ncbi:MAG: HAMP domain-containing histidine kinase [Jatrophihabitans sp.]|nr:MAG: HAMP domain-containing histidine kinase [Jatrophihabitans sp.]